MMLRLYTYFRSSAAFRTRIALNLKGLPYEAVPVNLLHDEQLSPRYTDTNPSQLVPLLEDGTARVSQSLAIIEYLDETHPSPPLLPSGVRERAEVRALALAIACDIHPLNNRRVLRYLKDILGANEQARDEWARHWIELGFTALERRLASGGYSGRCCYGDAPGLADCFLIPQTVNALRVQCSLDRFPTIRRIYEHCMTYEAFQKAAPAAQSDAEA
jgi:maleylacetoacetate isomerase